MTADHTSLCQFLTRDDVDKIGGWSLNIVRWKIPSLLITLVILLIDTLRGQFFLMAGMAQLIPLLKMDKYMDSADQMLRVNHQRYPRTRGCS